MIAAAVLAVVVGLLWASLASAEPVSVVPSGYPGTYNWQFQDLDGPDVPGGNGRSTLPVDVGAGSSSVIYNGVPHTFYGSAGVLRHGWAPPTGWNFETLDGAGGPTGQTTEPVGSGSSAVVFGNDLHVFYMEVDAPTSVLRHSWYSAAANAWFAESLDGPGVTGGNGRTANQVGGVTAVNPGNDCGGSVIVITGTGFIGATAVAIGDRPPVSFVVISDTRISATVPSYVSGPDANLTVSVTTPGGTGSLDNAYSYCV